jgi:hypothetical protein
LSSRGLRIGTGAGSMTGDLAYYFFAFFFFGVLSLGYFYAYFFFVSYLAVAS